MSRSSSEVLIVGAGVFGAAAALTLARRGHRVTLLDRGPLPHPQASSTDISKVIRADYAEDALYMEAVLEALPTWRAWNAAQPRPLFHETGLLALSARPFAPGGFEQTCWGALSRRGLPLQRLTGEALRAQHPAWDPADYPDAYYNPQAGWAESGEVVRWLLGEAAAAGVRVRDDAHVVEVSENAPALRLASGERLSADQLVVAAGTWTPHLLPELAPRVKSVAQPVFHLAPSDPRPWSAPAFPVFTADITGTGWYGFPANAQGLVKIANHGGGLELHPDRGGEPGEAEEAALRDFLRARLPGLAEAPIGFRRRCFYCDSVDGDLLLDRHPERPGVLVASGGSGHAFKLAPVLGPWIADLVEGGEVEPRFSLTRPLRRATEAARLKS
ncbi:MAG: FAD-dependent oxidoreductase [Alphaproteobacteria bacterium]|nr:FAD-dependent oxidoreductase [Alphaproteobacteria bacterium]